MRLKSDAERGELSRMVAQLRRRVVRETERGKAIPKVTSVVPTSVEANLNLRFQYKKAMDAERAKYNKLEAENRTLWGRIKGLEEQLLKKGVTLESRTHRTNEILYWRNKFRDSESGKHSLEEILASVRKQLEKETKEKNKILNELEALRRWQASQLRAHFDEVDSVFGQPAAAGGGGGTVPGSRVGWSLSRGVTAKGRNGEDRRRTLKGVNEEEEHRYGRWDDSVDEIAQHHHDATSHPSARHATGDPKRKGVQQRSSLAAFYDDVPASAGPSQVPSYVHPPRYPSEKRAPPALPPKEAGSDTEAEDERMREAKIKVAYDVWVLNKEKEKEKQRQEGGAVSTSQSARA
ncbi:hypothetical protein HK104_001989 [Borealophlyctis nickersoniae]|nr:hypothetical protein HK104_001989 [Borealophlyctis nickersoniae]